MDVIQSLKSSIVDGIRRQRHKHQSGDSAYNSANETDEVRSDASSVGQLTPEQKKKKRQKHRPLSMQLKPRRASDTSSEDELLGVEIRARSGSASSPTPTCNINDLPIKISALGLNGSKAMRWAKKKDGNTYAITFDGKSRQTDETTHLWHVPSFDKTEIRIPEGGWIIQVCLKDPSKKDDYDAPPAEKSPEEPPTEESPEEPPTEESPEEPPTEDSPQPPSEESPQPPSEESPHGQEEGSAAEEEPLLDELQRSFEGSERSKDEIDGTDISLYPLRLVRTRIPTESGKLVWGVSVVHMDDQLLKDEPISSMWALEKHNDGYHTLREPSQFKMMATNDSPPQVTDKTKYLAVDEDTKEPFLVQAGEYHECLVIPQIKLAVTNADVYLPAI